MKSTLLYDRKVEKLSQIAQETVLQDTKSLLSDLMNNVLGQNEEVTAVVTYVTTAQRTTLLTRYRSLLSTKATFQHSASYVNHVADRVSAKITYIRQQQISPSLATLGIF